MYSVNDAGIRGGKELRLLLIGVILRPSRLVAGYAFDGDKLYLLHSARIGMLNVMLLRNDDVNEDVKF